MQRLLAAAGIASRRRAEDLIRAGRVSVNGRTARLGDRADPARDRICVDGEPVHAEALAYWVVNKPRGVLSTVRDPEGRPIVVDLVPDRRLRLFPVGRLDRDTEGLVLLTNDGELAHGLLHPSYEVEREYSVGVRGLVDDATLETLERGVPLEDGVTAPARVSHVSRDPKAHLSRFHLTLIEGRKRQIRRALRALGHPVVTLCRVRMGSLRLGALAPGAARRLDAAEVARLRRGPGRRGGPRRPATPPR